MPISSKLKLIQKILFFSILSLLTQSPEAVSKNLSKKMGLGSNHIGAGETTPAFSLNYHLSESNHMEGFFGIDTADTSEFLLWGMRYNRNLYLEEQMNFFITLGGGLLTKLGSGATASASGYMMEAGLGGEFFLTGLPNLGLSLTTAFRFESPSAVRIRTAFYGGFHYYF